jgi:hypothetical protein
MKKLILAILAVGTITSAQAQKAGSILIYGSVGYGTDKVTDNDGLPGSLDAVTKERTWNFSPAVGYQFNENWTIGLQLNMVGTKVTHDNDGMDDEATARDMEIGPFIRHTMPITPTFFVFNQLNLSYHSGTANFDDGVVGTPDIETQHNGFGISWFPAVGVNFTKCMALNFSFGGLGYHNVTTDLAGPAEAKDSGFNFNFGQTVNIGISANIGIRKHSRGHAEPGMDSRRLNTTSDEDDE